MLCDDEWSKNEILTRRGNSCQEELLVLFNEQQTNKVRMWVTTKVDVKWIYFLPINFAIVFKKRKIYLVYGILSA